MTGESLDYKKHLSLKYGDYCQVHENDTPRNSQKARSQGAICLGPTWDQEGNYRFFTLRTAKVIKRHGWDKMETPDAVIARVNELGKGQPSLAVFKDRKGRVIGDYESAGVMEAKDEAPKQVRFHDPVDELKPPATPDQEPDGPDIEPEPALLEPKAQPDEEPQLQAVDLDAPDAPVEPEVNYEEPAPTAAPDTATTADVPALTAEHTEAPAEPAESAGVRRLSLIHI